MLLYIFSLGGIKMNRITPLMLLTLVVFSLGMPNLVWAADEDDAPACTSSELAELKKAETALKSQLTVLEDKTDSEQIKKERRAKQVEHAAKAAEVARCETSRSEKKTEKKDVCKTAFDKFNEAKKDFKYTDMIAAEKCMGADSEDINVAATLLSAYVQSHENVPKEGCDNYLKDNKSEVKDLKSEVKKINEDITSDEKKVAEAQADLAKEMLGIKEEKSKLEEAAEDATADTLKRIQKRQDELQQALIEAGSKMIEARQALDTIPEGLNSALMNHQYEGEYVDLTDNQSVELFCKNKVKKYASGPKNGDKNAPTKKLSENSASKGTAKVAELRKIFDSCKKRLSNSRSNITAAHERALAKAQRNVEDLQFYITKRTEELKKTTEEYKTETEKINSRLLKAASQLNEKFNTTYATGNAKIAAIQKGIEKNQKVLTGTLNTQGKMSTKNAKEVMGKYDEMEEIYSANESCPQFKGYKPEDNLKKNRDRFEESQQ